jgi:hypothetical protein
VTTTLHPTKTRLALLREVRAGWVFHDPDRRISYVRYPNTVRTVTDSILTLARAGWVTCSDRNQWQLTEAGAEVLDAR